MSSLKSKIVLLRESSAHLRFRETVHKLFKELDSDKVVFDFSGILTISRSFAHEYVAQKKRSEKSIEEKGVSEDVRKVFEVVQKKDSSSRFDRSTWAVKNDLTIMRW